MCGTARLTSVDHVAQVERSDGYVHDSGPDLDPAVKGHKFDFKAFRKDVDADGENGNGPCDSNDAKRLAGGWWLVVVVGW